MDDSLHNLVGNAVDDHIKESDHPTNHNTDKSDIEDNLIQASEKNNGESETNIKNETGNDNKNGKETAKVIDVSTNPKKNESEDASTDLEMQVVEIHAPRPPINEVGQNPILKITDVASIPNSASVSKTPGIKGNVVPLISLDNLMKIYSTTEMKQNMVIPQEIIKLTRVSAVINHKKPFNSELLRIFNSIEKPNFLPIDRPKKPGRRSHKNNDRYVVFESTSSDENDESAENDSTFSINYRPSSETPQVGRPPKQSKYRTAVKMVPVKRMTIFDVTNRRYAPWIEIVSRIPRRPFHQRANTGIYKEEVPDIVTKTFEVIRNTKSDKKPNKALKAIAKDPAAVLALGPQYPMNLVEKQMLENKEKIKLRDKNIFAFKLLPITRNESTIPAHSVFRKIYKEARVDTMNNLSKVNRYLNNREIRSKITRITPTSDLQRAASYLWKAPKQTPTNSKYQSRHHIIVESTQASQAAAIQSYESSISSCCTISNESISAQAEIASRVLHSSFEAPFWVNFEYERQKFQKL